jgi:integrase
MSTQRHVNYALRPTVINAAKAKEKAYVLTDGGGLYIEVLPGGSKVWRYTFRLAGKRPKLTIGPYPQIGIAQARDQHETMRAMVAQGIDPMTQRRETAREVKETEQKSVTFRDFSLVWVHETLRHLSENYRTQNIRFLDVYICPQIGDMRLGDVLPRDVLAIIEKYKATPTTADKCRSLIQQVYNFAIRKLLVDTNPATPVRGAIRVPQSTHHRHLSEPELAKFWRELEMQRAATVITVYAAKLLMLTMTRKSELRLAKWVEFDLDEGRWDVPSTRMKMRIPHRVWLSRQAMEMLLYLQKITGGGEYLFPTRFTGGNGRPISEATLNHFFKRLDFGVPEFSPHGTRSTAATLLREHGFQKDVVELLLAHAERDQSAAAYSHMQLKPERQKAMQFLADKIDELTAPPPAPLPLPAPVQ